MSTIRIDKEFHALIPPLSAEERVQLEANLRADGCRDPLVVWNGLLLDGHNRYEICQKHKIPFRVVVQECEDRLAAKVWIRRHQLGRRNLTDYTRGVMALALNDDIATQVQADGARQREANKAAARRPGHVVAPRDEKAKRARSTNAKLGELAGLPESKIRKIKVLEREAPESTKADLHAGNTTINREYTKLTTDRPAARKRAQPISVDDPHVRRVQVLLTMLPEIRRVCDKDSKLTSLVRDIDKWMTRLNKKRK